MDHSKLEQLVSNIKEVLWLVSFSEEEKILYCSPSYEKIWGAPLSELYENPKSWMDSILEEHQLLVKEAFDTFEVGNSKTGDFD